MFTVVDHVQRLVLTTENLSSCRVEIPVSVFVSDLKFPFSKVSGILQTLAASSSVPNEGVREGFHFGGLFIYFQCRFIKLATPRQLIHHLYKPTKFLN